MGKVLWAEKRYNNFSYFLKNKFKCKVVKISVDAGFNCPNRDGKISYGGCIFCSEEGSGEFAGARNISIKEQFEQIKSIITPKWPVAKYIIHFQAFTNTYAPINILRQKYTEALHQKDVVGIAIATRPDCIDEKVIELLDELNKRTYVFVELGLQTSNEKTAEIINRGYNNQCFIDCVKKLREKNIDVVVHLIVGLPGEVEQDVLKSVDFISKLDIQGVKFHLLYVVKGTKLEQIYNAGEIKLLEKDEYVEIIVDCIERLKPDIVIHRLTGDGKKETLIGPRWSLDKMRVLSSIDKRLRERETYQGKIYSTSES